MHRANNAVFAARSEHLSLDRPLLCRGSTTPSTGLKDLRAQRRLIRMELCVGDPGRLTVINCWLLSSQWCGKDQVGSPRHPQFGILLQETLSKASEQKESSLGGSGSGRLPYDANSSLITEEVCVKAGP